MSLRWVAARPTNAGPISSEESALLSGGKDAAIANLPPGLDSANSIKMSFILLKIGEVLKLQCKGWRVPRAASAATPVTNGLAAVKVGTRGTLSVVVVAFEVVSLTVFAEGPVLPRPVAPDSVV